MSIYKNIIYLVVLTTSISCLAIVTGQQKINYTITISPGSSLDPKYRHSDSQILGSEYFHGSQKGISDDPNANDRVRLWLKKNSDTEEVVTKIKVFNF